MGIVAKLIFERQGKDYDAKLEELSNLSDIQTVQRKANKLNLGEVYPSNRKDKKYMIQDPEAMKIVHFGQMIYSDYTKTKDSSKRKMFRNRNKKWAYAQPYTPAYLSYWLLW
jgi:exopolysaccharide biosynthesis predicted pyruvyltransferase EpsI